MLGIVCGTNSFSDVHDMIILGVASAVIVMFYTRISMFFSVSFLAILQLYNMF